MSKLKLKRKKYFKLKQAIIPYIKYYFFNKKETEVKTKYKFAITVIVKNEAPYIVEWIEFHKIVGAEKIYLYDNESTDNLKEIIKPYTDSGFIEYTYFPGQKMQMPAYNDSINKHKNEVEFMAIIDADEFIVPVKHNSVPEFLDFLEKETGKRIDGVGINWLLHGYNAHRTKQEGLVTEIYNKCEYKADLNIAVKSIIRTESAVFYPNPHFCLHRFGANVVTPHGIKRYGPFNINFDHEYIRINHYLTKSLEEYMERSKKGKADGAKYTPDFTFNPDLYSTDEDLQIKKFIPKLHEVIK